MIVIPQPKKSFIRYRHAFTLVEMLIAMAITLLMMAAVARAFAFVGERVRDSRGSLALSSDLRDITTRLNDELRRCTVSLRPVGNNEPDPNGYFLYSEGPCTDATSALFGRYNSTIVDGSTVAEDSRYGDIDDYLAFTAVAPPGSWFTGKVPAYVLDSSVSDSTPVVIRSKYAEIVYFTNPERDATGNVVDTDGNNLPDRLLLYRRVLLVRPDLNLGTGGTVLGLSPGTDWLTGLADIHQLCDLSVRRSLNVNGTPNLNTSATVVANSLSDLAQPHNRFGHVRIPWGSATVTPGAVEAGDTSMPILALEDPINLITSVTDGTSSTPSYRPPDSDTVTEPVVTPMKWSGYLRREFVLAGTRKGEDVIANNCRALDVQIFDQNAAFYLPTSNLVVGPGDAGYREVLDGSGALPPLVPGGGFVDLAYPVLAGGPTRGWQSRSIATGEATYAALTGGARAANLQSDFSGLEFKDAAGNSTVNTFPPFAQRAYSNSLLKSGRLVINTANEIVLFQPAFDTYTSAYERDGFYQGRRFQSALYRGTAWYELLASEAYITDLAADGLDSPATPSSAPPSPTILPMFPDSPGTDDIDERETSAPFTMKPEAVRITVRLENVATRQLRQLSVVHRGDR
ncbi:prepilin-type N-terminal cleavage/methylation domain-containing protein [Aporhodopirellula aestuarii]|uniref:Prepilin-type N-terminal cleavage/methylation domain-containing protein n=1 Tax=Aporhodopirellula aestuarii TaxID=2950107 RepID=A0ABT0U4A4_9BACT|nr:prepilin-type N-terminal cleavage/methylation domain-containing protein [Aporhodopirellula aestuarii]MCM2371758.1 prepilin-type N-terminal cleavage/methylation domain-containing protein [Aporhodopirellula aestuarii]